jgi:hypothetical protein
MNHHDNPPFSSSSEGFFKSPFHSVLQDGDSQFLLRCALTHDWDTLIGFCQFLEEIFTVSVPDRVFQWQENRIRAGKRQLLAQDQWGNSALHAACYNKPPVRVVTALLTAASVAPPEPLQIHTILSRDQSNPLLIACATGASLQVIEALLDPPGSGLLNGGSLVTVADQLGSTPLSELAVHYELQRKSPMYAQTALPLDQVHLINTNNGGGILEEQRYDGNYQYHRSRSRRSRRRNRRNNSRDDCLLETFRNKLERILQAAWSASNNTNSSSLTSIVHGAAHIAATVPPVVTRLVCRGYPHMISFTDRHGVLPLHLAVSSHSLLSSSCKNTTGSLPLLLSRHAYFVEQLLNYYPASAQMVVPNTGGRFPLVQAIASGLWWHTMEGGKGPLQLLWEAAPRVLSQLDPVTGLYPAMVAATSMKPWSSSNNNNGTNENSVDRHEAVKALQLDTLYFLLRLYPQVISEMLATNDI